MAGLRSFPSIIYCLTTERTRERIIPMDPNTYQEQLNHYRERAMAYRQQFKHMTNEQLIRRYVEEMTKLKMNLRARSQGKPRPCAYPNTLDMNLCQRELDRRSVLVPEVTLPAADDEDTQR
jgi:hypothetical protein